LLPLAFGWGLPRQVDRARSYAAKRRQAAARQNVVCRCSSPRDFDHTFWWCGPQL